MSVFVFSLNEIMLQKYDLESENDYLPNTNKIMQEPEDDSQSLPPFVKSWRQLYWLVAGSLVAVIIFLVIFDQVFR